MSDTEKKSSDEKLVSGKLLVACANLPDPVFGDAVILLVEHAQKGSMGIILNKAFNDLAYEELVKGFGYDILKYQDEKTAFIGGPMGGSSTIIIHDSATGPEGAHSIGSSGISLSVDLKELENTPPDNIRICLGYAGWGDGQLADEIESIGSWTAIDVDLDLIFNTPSKDMYKEAAKRAGIDPSAPFSPPAFEP